jgi:hypothetical protein
MNKPRMWISSTEIKNIIAGLEIKNNRSQQMEIHTYSSNWRNALSLYFTTGEWKVRKD